MPVAPYPKGKARCVSDTGTSPNIGDQNCPTRSVVLMKPLMVRVSPAPTLTDCWATAGRAPSSRIPATTSPENHVKRALMISSWGETACERHSSLHRPHGEALDEAIDEEIVDD